jgi:hypothetical protein
MMEKWRFYLREALTQLGFARSAFDAFEQARAAGDTRGLFRSLHHLLVHVTDVDKLLRPKPGTRRAALLAGHVDLSGVDLSAFRDARNHLEHFDERLDSWVREYDGYAFFDMNIITGCKGFPDRAYLRALDGDTFKFYGESYPLGPLRDAVDILQSRLRSLGE